MSVYATLTSLPASDDTLPPLIGGPSGLDLSVSVNGGLAGGSILVSAAPVDTTSAVENTLSLKLLFQPPDTSHTPSSLASGWQPDATPTLRIFFPYAGPEAVLPAPLALTDDLQPGATGYDAITSAWNIQVSLDPTDPSIQQNDYWSVSCDSTGPGPVWVVMPEAGNTGLFTNAETARSQPGPTLTLYGHHIVSALPIDDSPGTILYVQWSDFPGFADGAVANLLPKTAFSIDTFDVTVDRTTGGPQLKACWTTTGADHCVISGNTDWQPPCQPDGYTQAVTAAAPLLQTYTLTVYPTPTADSPITRSVTAQWIQNSTIGGVEVDDWRKLATTPNGKFVLAAHSLEADLRGSIQVFDAETLTATSVTLTADSVITDFAFRQDVMYVTSILGRIAAFDTTNNFALLASSASPVSIDDLAAGIDCLIALSQDGQTIAQTYGNNYPDSVCVLLLVSRTTLEPSAPATTLPAIATALAVGNVSGSLYLATNDGLMIRDATFGTATRTIRVQAQYIWQLALSPDEQTAYLQVDVNGDGSTNALVRLDVATGVATAQTQLAFAYSDIGNLALTPDGTTLFLLASTLPTPGGDNGPRIDSRLAAYDATTLQELSWSPITFDDQQPLDIAMTADGSRLFVLTNPQWSLWADPTMLYAVDPVFS